MSAKTAEPNEIPIDWEKGLHTCGGDEAMFKMMISQFESLSFDENMNSLFNSIMDMDHAQVKFHAHTLKGPLSYLAAEKCVVLAKDIMQAGLAKDEPTILSKYLQFLEASKVLKVYLASQTNKKPDLSKIERYEREVKAKYFRPITAVELQEKERPAGCCATCNMF